VLINVPPETWQASGKACHTWQAFPAVQNSVFFPFRSEKTGIYRKTPEFPEFRAESATKVDGFLCHNLFDQIFALTAKSLFTDADHAALEYINKHITTVILKADKQCHWLNQAPWSAELHQAYLIHWYWVLHLSEQWTGCNLQSVLDDIVAALPNPIDTTGTISQNLTKSHNQLREVKQQALQKQLHAQWAITPKANSFNIYCRQNKIAGALQP